MEWIKNGGARIQQMIDEAVENETRRAVICGQYEIEKTIRIPSDFTLVLQDCHLRMADNTFCNMIVNEHCGTEAGRTIEGCDRNIAIEGRGRVVLDGGTYNGLCEENSEKDGNPHIYVNNVLLFSNMEHFKISGLHIRNQRWWAMCFHFCRFGQVSDIDFRADCRRWDENGELVEGLDWKKVVCPKQMVVRNADGIDLRLGCHDIRLEHITGFTQDDTIALTALDLANTMVERFRVKGLSTDIYNVTIRDVNAASFCALVRLLNQGGTRLYNVLVDGVMDASKDCPYLERGHSAIRIGDEGLYGSRHSTADETYNIVIRNVYTRAFVGVRLVGEIRNLSMENIYGFDGCGTIEAGECLSAEEVERELKKVRPAGHYVSRHYAELAGASVLIDNKASLS